jgi:asparagine synthase (glutamine-hydrolysing)
VRVHEVAPMLATIAYRGPDDEAFDSLPGYGIGFRRLSIVDVAGGRQPLKTVDGRLTLVCNGEIYNQGELRACLTARGHVFRTASDSEVVLHAYAEWGSACPERLRGIFAFAIWDAWSRSLFLCRDRSGIKPLFLRLSHGELLFASEAKAVLAHRSTPRRLDLVSCLALLDEDVMLERSPFDGISQLGAGCSAQFGVDETLRTSRYWSYQPTLEPGDDHSEQENVAAFREELERVVRMQLMADVPVGGYLSGGLDSAVVCALAGARADGFETFTSVCGDSDDPWFAYVVARARGLTNHAVAFETDGFAEALATVAWAAEGTFDLGFLCRHQLAASAADRGLKVLLSGQGADELLGGYGYTYSSLVTAVERSAVASRLRGSGWRDLVQAVALPRAHDVDVSAADVSEAEARRVAAWLKRAHTALSSYLLRFEDRMGMLAGVEVRVPFLDHVLVDLCAAIPPRRRATLFGGKRLLREAALGLVPEPVRVRQKWAFNSSLPPMTQMLEASRADTGLDDLLTEETVRSKGYFEAAAVRRLRDERNYHLLDAVLIVHLLDELFVTAFDPSRFAGALAVRGREIVLDPTWMPAETIVGAAGGSGMGDVPSVHIGVVYVGLLNEVEAYDVDARTASTPVVLLAVLFADGGRRYMPVPDGIDAELAVQLARSADGMSTYRELATTLEATPEHLLAAARFLVAQGVLLLRSRGARTAEAVSTARSAP